MAQFSAHGSPFYEAEGLVRSMVYDSTGQKTYLMRDEKFVEYDEETGEYTEIATAPLDTSISEQPIGDHGNLIGTQEWAAPNITSSWEFALHDGQLLAYRHRQLRIYDNNGLRRIINYPTTLPRVGSRADVYNNHLYLSTDFTSNPMAQRGLLVLSLETDSGTFTQGTLTANFMSVLPNRIATLTLDATNFYINFYTHSLALQSGEQITIPRSTLTPHGGTPEIRMMKADADHIYLITRQPVSGTNTRYLTQVDYSGNVTLQARISDDSLLFQGGTLELDRLHVFNYNTTQDEVDQYTYRVGSKLSYQQLVPIQMATPDFDSFYFLATNNIGGDALSTATFNVNALLKYVKSTDTWTALLDGTTGQPQLAHAYDFISHMVYYADNRKSLAVVERNNKTFIFYRRVESLTGSIAYYNETDDTLTNIRSETFVSANNAGVPYSMDFAIDEQSDGIHVYSFVVRYVVSGGNVTSATLKVFRERVEPSGTETEIFSETITEAVDSEYPISVSDIILAEDRSKWYFVLDWFYAGTTETGRSELCSINKDGSGTREVLKTYTNPLVGARSPAKVGSKYFYLEGGWLRRPKTSSDADVPDAEHYYPTDGGHLVEIASTTDRGQVWRSQTIDQSPDSDDPIYGGWGLHNSMISNMIVDSKGSLRFVAGYGYPFRVQNNLPIASQFEPVPIRDNYMMLQYGDELATKIHSYPVDHDDVWAALTQLAGLMNYEIGFGPAQSVVDKHQTANPTVTDWQANAAFFFRPRTILPAELRTAISATGTPTTIGLDQSGTEAERSEFPAPASGESNMILIDNELFVYTAVTTDSQGLVLSGIARAQNGSTATAHAIDANVYFVDYFASGIHGQTLVDIENRQPDFVNLYNEININYGINVYTAQDSVSIAEHGKRTLDLEGGQTLLSRHDRVWAESIADSYLARSKDLKERLRLRLLFSPELDAGQLVVVHQNVGIQIPYKPFRCVEVTHDLQTYQTSAIVVEV